MARVNCGKGHWYDPSVTPSCPQCAAEAGGYGAAGASVSPTEPAYGSAAGGNIGATEPVYGSATGGNVSATEPFHGGGFNFGGAASIGATEPVTPGSGSMGNWGASSDAGGTIPANPERSFFPAPTPTQPLYASDSVSAPDNAGFAPMQVTMPLGADQRVFSPRSERPSARPAPPFRPVVGWLVCVDGADRGRDYQIRDGYNTIGREPGNDIAIQNDNHISREKHAMIAYDRREKLFFFGPADGRNIVRLNGKLLMQASELHPYDIIDFESTKLMFVPFCGERFNWDE